MKKATKILISATAVAAVIGVGAVSYAAWTAGDLKPQTVGGTTGTVRIVGDFTVTPSDATGSAITALNALYPVDYRGDGLQYWEFKLSADVTDDSSVTYKLAGELESGLGGDTVSAKLYWSTTAPTATTQENPDNELTSTAKELALGEDNTVFVYMVATGTDAMKAKITLTFSAE
ncbi:MAG: hypothetical protein K2F90_06260 [Clostridiales bacterium]|nr:hypothetical protein [Clostridiales bacterium]